MTPLFLADLEGKTEKQIKKHLVKRYKAKIEEVAKYTILIAYESVGNWGCDSTSWFLLRDSNGQLFENHASHNSTYGFEGQFTPEETTSKYLLSDNFNFSYGLHDNDGEKHHEQVNEWLERYIS